MRRLIRCPQATVHFLDPEHGQPLLVGITRFQLVANRKYQNDFVVWQPSVFGDVSMPTSGEHEFSAPLLGEPAHQGVVGQQFECASDTEELRARSRRIVRGDEFE